MSAVRAAPLALVVLCGCATARIDAALYDARSVAVASVFARKLIDFDNVPVAPMLADNDLGSEVLEMELGEMEGRLSEIFGVDVVPAGKAIQQRAYAGLPEARPPEDFTRVNDMIPVDIEAPAAATALGVLARAMGVDAVVVVRHEWTLTRDRFDVGEGITAFDRCSILVVDAAGKALWDDVVIARVPMDVVMPGAFSVGLNGGTWADEARQVARRASRQALDAVDRRYRESRTVPTRPSTPTPAPGTPERPGGAA